MPILTRRSPNPRYYAVAAIALIVLALALPAAVSPSDPLEPHHVWTYLADMELPDAEVRVGSALVRVFVAVLYLLFLLTRLRFPTLRIPVAMLLIYAGVCGVTDAMTALSYRPPFSGQVEMYAASAALAGLASLACQIFFVIFLHWERNPPPDLRRKDPADAAP